jgi:ABC-type molybdate transport system substrate-binding protein
VLRVVVGGMDAAIVYRANTTLQLDKLKVMDIDDPAAKAVQPIALAKQSKHPYLAGRLMENIRAAKSRQRFEELGFRWLGESKSE